MWGQLLVFFGRGCRDSEVRTSWPETVGVLDSQRTKILRILGYYRYRKQTREKEDEQKKQNTQIYMKNLNARKNHKSHTSPL